MESVDYVDRMLTRTDERDVRVGSILTSEFTDDALAWSG